MPGMTAAADELTRALGVHFVHFTGESAIEQMVSRPWASITFAGERHEIKVRLKGRQAGAAADSFLHRLNEREFHLRGHILADIALVAQERSAEGVVCLCLEALTVEAC